MIPLPASLVPYAGILNAAVTTFVVLTYAASVRLIGTRWARWQWDTWRDALLSTPKENLVRWWFLFPGMAFQGKIGERIPTRFSWTPRHWLAPMTAVSVTRCHANPSSLTDQQRNHRLRSKRFTLQMQALFWAPSLVYNLGLLLAIGLGMVVWVIVWYGLLGIPRFAIRLSTKTRDADLGIAVVSPDP